MNVKTIMPSDIRERQRLYGITCTWNLKNNTNGCICKTDLQTQKTNLCYKRGEGKGRDKLAGMGLTETNHHI